VEVESFLEEEDIIRISAIIYCERDSQKGIIIGKAGSALKRVGMMARKDIEDFFQKQVFLQLYVKVDRDWRSNTGRLKHYGYDLT
jgi:GTP-binding protein Era